MIRILFFCSLSRQIPTGINVSNAPVPVVLNHAGFKKLLFPVSTSKQTVKLCPLERFFGSILLRYELIRVMRVDDTVSLHLHLVFLVCFLFHQNDLCTRIRQLRELF